MQMYTVEERGLLLEQLISFAEQVSEVAGFLLVGSGATGFRDRYSDLDVLLVAEKPEAVEGINQAIITYVTTDQRVLRHKTYRHEEDIFVTCFFLEHYLNLDVGIWSLQKLRATKPDWIIKLDKTGVIGERLQQTWAAYKQTGVNEVIRESLSAFWQFVHNSFGSISRGNGIKAAKDLDVIRDQIIRIICHSHGRFYDYSKYIDSIDSPYVPRLKKTYEVPLDRAGLIQGLTDLVVLYFDIIREIDWDK